MPPSTPARGLNHPAAKEVLDGAGLEGPSEKEPLAAIAITIGLLVHAQLVPDPDTIVECLGHELRAMARLVPAAG